MDKVEAETMTTDGFPALMRSVSDVSHEVCEAKPDRMRNAQPFRIA